MPDSLWYHDNQVKLIISILLKAGHKETSHEKMQNNRNENHTISGSDAEV